MSEVINSINFNGQTIELSQSQKDRLKKDLDLIDYWQGEVDAQLTAYNYNKSQYDSYYNRNCGTRNALKPGPYDNCMRERQTGMDYHGPLRDAAKAKWEAAVTSLASATKNYNDDLAAIQNEIKLQVQASQATSASQQSAASSYATTQQSDPRVLINQQNQQAAIQAKKEEVKKQIITYTIFGIVIVVIAVVVIKKLF